MAKFPRLCISGAPQRLLDAVNEIEESLADGWTRDKEKEKELACDGGEYYWFSCSEKDWRPAADLVFLRDKPDRISVSNVMPRKDGRLTLGTCNAIVEEFFT